MNDLQNPLGEHLEPSHDEATLRRMWSNVQARRAQRPSPWLAVPALASVAIATFLLWPREIVSPVIERAPITELRAVDLSPTMFTPEVVRTGDGSQIVVMPGARLIPLERTTTIMGWRLERGEASFDVRREPSRTFYVEAGDIRVVVIGTRFRVRHDGSRVQVDVDRGEVRVERAGDAVSITAGHGFDSAPPAPVVPPVEVTTTAPTKPLRPEKDPPIATPKVAEEPVVIDPLAEADRARADGRANDALTILSTFVESTPDDPRRGLATFMLARIWQDDRGEPLKAAPLFELAATRGLPEPLEARALARVVDCYVTAGDRRAARAAARRYLERHPNGAKAEQIRRWAEPR